MVSQIDFDGSWRRDLICSDAYGTKVESLGLLVPRI